MLIYSHLCSTNMEYLYSSFQFQPIFGYKVSLLWMLFCWIIFFFHSASDCLSIDEFNAFTFKVIIDEYFYN